ncbi:hypothetical protein EDD11_005777 [Mortierella claussenii]|nr:hypothetical protein EDD11_005777 [Mortierella claussenii]
MDPTAPRPLPESILFSPSLKKTRPIHSHPSPKGATPSRLYLRQSFPTLTSREPEREDKEKVERAQEQKHEQELPSTTTPRSSPGITLRQQHGPSSTLHAPRKQQQHLQVQGDDGRRLKNGMSTPFSARLSQLQQQQQRQRQQQQQQQQQQYTLQNQKPVDISPAIPSTPSSKQPPSAPIVEPLDSSGELVSPNTLRASSIHVRHAQEMTEALDRILDSKLSPPSSSSLSATLPSASVTSFSSDSLLSRLFRPIPADNIPKPPNHGLQDQQQPSAAPAAPRLRTTETEYDLSPARSARLLSTPSRSLYEGTPSKVLRPNERDMGQVGYGKMAKAAVKDSFRLEEEQDVEDAVEDDVENEVPSPLERHWRYRRPWQEQSLRRRDADGRNSDDELDERNRQQLKKLDQRYTKTTTQNEQNNTDQEEEEGVGEDNVEDDDDRHHAEREYSYGDEEVSFRRPNLTLSSSNQSTLVEQLQPSLGKDPSTAHPEQGQTPGTPAPGGQRSTYNNRIVLTEEENIDADANATTDSEEEEAENSLLEVAEKTAAITQELRDVYSNLQELFSPEKEAKLQEAVTILNSAWKETNGTATHSVDAIGATASSSAIPRTLSSSIHKRKPAPLRPARILGVQDRSPSSSSRSSLSLSPENQSLQYLTQQTEQRQQQLDGRPSRRVQMSNNITTSLPHHDVTVRGLISDAESARRLLQGTRGRGQHQAVRRPENAQDIPAITPSSRTKLDAQTEIQSSELHHQEQFRRKLDRWKRVELQNRDEAPLLPIVYPDLYIPTTSSRGDHAVVSAQHDGDEEYDHGLVDQAEVYDKYDDDDTAWGAQTRAGEATMNMRGLKQRAREETEYYKARILEEVQLQLDRENEMVRERKGKGKRKSRGSPLLPSLRPPPHVEHDDEERELERNHLIDRRRSAKRRTEDAFWSA